jgi:UDP-glucose 4-epimerase
MRIFLTGATGFIGSHLLALALKAGHEVVALRRKVGSAAVVPLPHEPLWIEGSLESLRVCDLQGCAVVVHLASAGVSPKQVPWLELVQANVVGSAHVVATAHAAGIRRIVVAGTCHEYGASAMDYDAIPADAALEPLNLYGASKAAAFQLVSAFARVHGLELFYGRIFSAYGEGQYEGNFWPSLRKAALNGEDFPMTSGRQIRDFMPVEAVATELLRACERIDLRPGEPCTENIGTGHPMPLLAFAQQEWQRLDASGQILPGARADRPDDVERFVPLLPSH